MITVHAGLHKTGSTAIQESLSLLTHRSDLRVLRPVYDGAQINAEWLCWVKRKSRRSHIVISDESILGEPEFGYASASERSRIWSRALQGEQVTFVIVLRHQLGWLESVFLQLVQQGEAMEATDFWEQMKGYAGIRWNYLVNVLGRDFGDRALRLLPYVPGSDIVSAFFSAIELSPPVRPRGIDGRANVSIRPEYVPIMRAMLQAPPVGSQRLAVTRNFLQRHAMLYQGPQSSPFPEVIQREIIAAFDEDWSKTVSVVAARGLTTEDGLSGFQSQGRQEVRKFAGNSFADSGVQMALTSLLASAAFESEQANHLGHVKRMRNKFASDPLGMPAAAYRKIKERLLRHM